MAQKAPRTELLFNYGFLHNDNLANIYGFSDQNNQRDYEIEEEFPIITQKYDAALAIRIKRRHGLKLGMGFYNNGRRFEGSFVSDGQSWRFDKTFVQRYLVFNISHYYAVSSEKWFRCHLEHGYSLLSKAGDDRFFKINDVSSAYFLKLTPTLLLSNWRIGIGAVAYLPLEDFSYGNQTKGDFRPFASGLELTAGFAF